MKGFSKKLSVAKARIGITPPYFKGDLEALLDGALWVPVIKKVSHHLMREDYLAPELPPADFLVYEFLAPFFYPKVIFVIHTFPASLYL